MRSQGGANWPAALSWAVAHLRIRGATQGGLEPTSAAGLAVRQSRVSRAIRSRRRRSCAHALGGLDRRDRVSPFRSYAGRPGVHQSDRASSSSSSCSLERGGRTTAIRSFPVAADQNRSPRKRVGQMTTSLPASRPLSASLSRLRAPAQCADGQDRPTPRRRGKRRRRGYALRQDAPAIGPPVLRDLRLSSPE